ncbi:hypothetical protein P4475_19225, partial [Halalkalibacterium halodurans]|uniref:hypothetical protein n=1 Tax=Halalkalibacterium halodurans TaxID=86665 RepID=UPI002E21D7FA|nr:hypothetical protein [Halalkalibacterium halodurans]
HYRNAPYNILIVLIGMSQWIKKAPNHPKILNGRSYFSSKLKQHSLVTFLHPLGLVYSNEQPNT